MRPQRIDANRVNAVVGPREIAEAQRGDREATPTDPTNEPDERGTVHEGDLNPIT